MLECRAVGWVDVRTKPIFLTWEAGWIVLSFRKQKFHFRNSREVRVAVICRAYFDSEIIVVTQKFLHLQIIACLLPLKLSAIDFSLAKKKKSSGNCVQY